MEEVLPVLSGIVIGLITHRLSPVGLRAVLFAVLTVAAGIGASWVSGELAISWTYILIDVAQVLVAGVLSAVAAERWPLRAWRRSQG
jgi:hypothetical protein